MSQNISLRSVFPALIFLFIFSSQAWAVTFTAGSGKPFTGFGNNGNNGTHWDRGANEGTSTWVCSPTGTGDNNYCRAHDIYDNWAAQSAAPKDMRFFIYRYYDTSGAYGAKDLDGLVDLTVQNGGSITFSCAMEGPTEDSYSAGIPSAPPSVSGVRYPSYPYDRNSVHAETDPWWSHMKDRAFQCTDAVQHAMNHPDAKTGKYLQPEQVRIELGNELYYVNDWYISTTTGGSNVGNGWIGGVSAGRSTVQDETIILTCISTATNGGTFSVVGSVSGNLGTATVGTAFTSPQVNFTLNDGSTDFALNDTFTLRPGEPSAKVAVFPPDVSSSSVLAQAQNDFEQNILFYSGNSSIYWSHNGRAVGDQVVFTYKNNYAPNALPPEITSNCTPTTIGSLPLNGYICYVVASDENHITVSATNGGTPITPSTSTPWNGAHHGDALVSASNCYAPSSMPASTFVNTGVTPNRNYTQAEWLDVIRTNYTANRNFNSRTSCLLGVEDDSIYVANVFPPSNAYAYAAFYFTDLIRNGFNDDGNHFGFRASKIAITGGISRRAFEMNQLNPQDPYYNRWMRTSRWDQVEIGPSSIATPTVSNVGISYLEANPSFLGSTTAVQPTTPGSSGALVTAVTDHVYHYSPNNYPSNWSTALGWLNGTSPDAMGQITANSLEDDFEESDSRWLCTVLQNCLDFWPDASGCSGSAADWFNGCTGFTARTLFDSSQYFAETWITEYNFDLPDTYVHMPATTGFKNYESSWAKALSVAQFTSSLLGRSNTPNSPTIPTTADTTNITMLNYFSLSYLSSWSWPAIGSVSGTPTVNAPYDSTGFVLALFNRAGINTDTKYPLTFASAQTLPDSRYYVTGAGHCGIAPGECTNNPSNSLLTSLYGWKFTGANNPNGQYIILNVGANADTIDLGSIPGTKLVTTLTSANVKLCHNNSQPSTTYPYLCTEDDNSLTYSLLSPWPGPNLGNPGPSGYPTADEPTYGPLAKSGVSQTTCALPTAAGSVPVCAFSANSATLAARSIMLVEVDSDGNGIPDSIQTDTSGQADSDGDFMSNQYETQVTHTSPTSATTQVSLCTSGSCTADTDGDGLTDGQEYTLGINLLNDLDPPLVATGTNLTIGIDDPAFGTAQESWNSVHGRIWYGDGSYNMEGAFPRVVDVIDSASSDICAVGPFGVACIFWAFDTGVVWNNKLPYPAAYHDSDGFLKPSITDAFRISGDHSSHVCIVSKTLGVYCWASDSTTDIVSSNIPSSLKNVSTVTDVAVGASHACALQGTTIKCWGSNTYGQAPGTMTFGTLAQQQAGSVQLVTGDVPLVSAAHTLVAGLNHTCVLVTPSGGGTAVRCWGDNSKNQRTVAALTAPMRIAAGDNHTCVIDGSFTNGSVATPNKVVCWGDNSLYQAAIPAMLTNNSTVSLDIRAGRNNSCVVTAGTGHNLVENALTCWPVGLNGLNTTATDTDGDGLSDYDEVNTYHTNPLLADTDGDTLSDGYEVNTSHTNPLAVDTDGDGLNDNVDPYPIQTLTQSISVSIHAPASADRGSTFNVAASAALPVTISVTGDCSIQSGGTDNATILMASNAAIACQVTYIQSGNATYYSASNSPLNDSATKITQVITPAGNPARAFLGDSFVASAQSNAGTGYPVSITASGGCSIPANTLSSGTVTMTSGFTACVINYSQAGDANFNAAVTVQSQVNAGLYIMYMNGVTTIVIPVIH